MVLLSSHHLRLLPTLRGVSSKQIVTYTNEVFCHGKGTSHSGAVVVLAANGVVSGSRAADMLRSFGALSVTFGSPNGVEKYGKSVQKEKRSCAHMT